MAKYTLQVKPTSKNFIPRDAVVTVESGMGWEAMSADDDFAAACANAGKHGWFLAYVNHTNVISINGKPIPREWVIPDHVGYGGNSIIIRPDLHADDFDFEVVD